MYSKDFTSKWIYYLYSALEPEYWSRRKVSVLYLYNNDMFHMQTHFIEKPIVNPMTVRTILDQKFINKH